MTKTCTKCKQTKDLEFFHKRPDRIAHPYRARCKDCLRIDNTKRATVLSKRTVITPPPFKYCPQCDTVKPGDMFFKHKRDVTGLASACKTCDMQKSYNYRKNNRDRWNEYCRNKQFERRVEKRKIRSKL